MFYLVELVPTGTNPDGTPLYTERALSNYGPFDLGSTAGMQAKAVSTIRGTKVQPRRAAQAGDWRERIQPLIDKQKPLPEGWDLEPKPDHFLRVSATQPWLVSYVASEMHGIIGRLTATKPGRYLQEFYPDVPEERRRELAASIENTGGFKVAGDAEQIEWVYENGPNSCMMLQWHYNDGDDGFSSEAHPTSVYAAGDLGIAYLLAGDEPVGDDPDGDDGDPDRRVSERALVWPEKLVYGRIYGDGSGRLKRALADAGYVPAEPDNWVGARLKRVIEKNEDGDYQFVVPYFDAGHSAGSGHRCVRDDGEFLRVIGEDDFGQGRMPCHSTMGHTTAKFAKGFEPWNVDLQKAA